MYPAFIEVAKQQKEYSAEISFNFAWEAEKTYVAFFERAKDTSDNDMDLNLEDIGVCEVCGYTVESEIHARTIQGKKR